MPDLTKARTVLKMMGWIDAVPTFGVEPDPDETPSERQSLLSLAPNIYEEMGRPDTITMTIEPGDLLNAPLGGEPGSIERAFNESEGDRSE